MTEKWTVFTWAKNPNGTGYIVASTRWTPRPDPDSYKVVATVATEAEARDEAADRQARYDAVRRATTASQV